jgi:protein-arginine kinase activator protein McsA
MEEISRHSTPGKVKFVNKCDCHTNKHKHKFDEQLVCSNCMVTWSQFQLVPAVCTRPASVLGSSSDHPSGPQKP